jgi:hypothetical protein
MSPDMTAAPSLLCANTVEFSVNELAYETKPTPVLSLKIEPVTDSTARLSHFLSVDLRWIESDVVPADVRLMCCSAWLRDWCG